MFDGVPDGGINSLGGDLGGSEDGAARVFAAPFPGTPSLAGLGIGGAVTYGHGYGTTATPELAAYKTTGQTTFLSFDPVAVADGERSRADIQAHYFVGPIGVLAEYARSAQRVALGSNAGTVVADAWTFETQWVITGEPSTYHNVTPREALAPAKHHWGAFDVVARYDELRASQGAFSALLLDPSKAARRARNYALGFDWFATAHLRASIDIERTTFRLGFAGSTDRPDETLFLGRLQAAF